MNFNKYRAFTIAELMVLLSVLTIILAAFAPVFTVRYNNASSENVWFFVANDDNANAYSDPISKVLTAQSFIGITPASKADVLKALRNDDSKTLYSKLTIRPSNILSAGEKQKQIQFRYGNSKTGSLAGALFADGTNLLFGGNYAGITDSAKYNSSYGSGSLDKITSGIANTALGFESLVNMKTGRGNTSIGYKAGYSLSSGTGNTLIGSNSGLSRSSGDYNTSIGRYSGTKGTGSYNTYIGDMVGYSAAGGTANTAIGTNTLLNTSGTGNTAVGSFAMASKAAGSYNTAIGSYACSAISGSYKTCIGYNSGSGVVNDSNNKGLLTDSTERVYIGGKPVENVGGAAVLEVHNVNSTNGNSMPRKNAGNSSVLINGNLIVRGQSYFGTARYGMGDEPALVGFKVFHVKDGSDIYSFAGFDGNERRTTTDEECGGRCQKHSEDRGKPNCVCTWGSERGYKSYDWTTQTTNAYSCMSSGYRATNGQSYTDGSGYGTVNIDRNFLSGAHPLNGGGNSCCPNLTSDIRLKDLESVYTAGLDEINRLKVYNYTYKNDPDKLPRVGVIAQDLKHVFPTAVSKDEDGYYKIRWDEMFYAAINAIKTINTKVATLASRVVKDQERIAALKQDNAKLGQKVDLLAKELTELEQRKK